MDILPTKYFEDIKRYWRRRKYQKLDDTNKRKLKVTRLGNKKRTVWKIRLVPKLRFKIFSTPNKLFAKFHGAYIATMIRLSYSNDNNEGKRIPKGRPVPIIVSSRDEIVDGRMVMEIYKRIVSTREIAALLV